MDSRERLSQDFAQCYTQMCAALGLSPLASVTAYAKIRTLSINADKIGSSDWVPLLNALKINEALETIIIRSYAKTSNTPESENKFVKKKSPAIKSDELVSRLCKCIRDCLAINGKIKALSLVGLNLKDVDVKVLSKGIQKNKSLTQLSLERSLDGANQFEDVLHVVRNNMKISCVNFSGCHVDATFARLIADYIKSQMSLRHDQVWQDGLRYRRPAMDSMGGLRRITINDNPEFRDEGVAILCSVMKEDIWIKAVDIQNCNITNEGGEKLLKMLELNASLVVVDARQNSELGSDILQKIRHQCRINWGTQECEFKWLSVNESERKNVQQKMKKPANSVSTTSGSCNSASKVMHSRSEVNKSGVPWRAASRANRLRNNSPERREPSTPSSSSTPSSIQQHQQQQHPSRIVQHNELLKMKEKDFEIKYLREQVDKLSMENSKLLSKCKGLEKKQAETEETLDVIENSFTSFHKFLDMLKQIGLGPLVEFAKLNDSSVNWNPDALKLQEPLNTQSKGRTSEHDELQLDVTNQMRSFLEERNFNSENLKMENMVEETGESKSTSKFDKLIDQVLRNGENLVRISSVSSGTTVKDLVNNITCSISADNIENHKYATVQKEIRNPLMKDFPKEGLKTVDDAYHERRVLREGAQKSREKLKAIENSDYSSQFEPMSSSDSATGVVNKDLSKKIEAQSRHPFLAGTYLREESEDDEASLDEGHGNISFDSVISDV